MSEPPTNDPRRLAEQDRALASLLGAARGYRASPRMRRRVLRMLGLPVALSLAGLASSASAGVLAVLSKVSLPTWIVVGAVAAGGGGMVAYKAYEAAPAKPAPTVFEGVRRASRLPATVPTPMPAPVAPTPALDDSTSKQREPRASRLAAGVPRRSVVTPRSRRAAVARPGPPAQIAALPPPAPAAPAARPVDLPPTQPPATLPPPLPLPAMVPPRRATGRRTTVLGEELALLAAADKELRRNGAGRALEVLTQYQQRFPGGSLREEATVLEIQAHVRAGHLQTASNRAKRFLADHPDSVFASRVRGMLSAASLDQERTSGGKAPGQRRQDP
jgi:hypothetical protein